MDSYGININPHIARQPAIEEILWETFRVNESNLWLQAATDLTDKWNIQLPLYIRGEWAAWVNYDKKARLFDYIQYPVSGPRGGTFAKRFSLITAVEPHFNGPERAYKDGQRVTVNGVLMQIVSASHGTKGWRYLLCYLNNDGSINKKRMQRSYFENKIFPFKKTAT
jgi:hypothetical protein